MKDYKKIHDTLGLETVQEMEALSPEDLKKIVFEANMAMQAVQNELDLNQKYQLLKDQKKSMESGKKEVDKRQKAKIKLALYLLEEKGKA